MKALVITRHYLDENLGGPNCSKAFVRAIADIYEDCTLMYPEHEYKATDLGFINNKSLRLIPCHDGRTKIQKGLDMYRGILHRFPAKVKETLEKERFDIIFLDHSITASSGVLEMALQHTPKVVTIHHNVEHDYIRDNQQSLLFRLPYNHFQLRAERKAVLGSCMNLALTEHDSESFVRLYGVNKDKVKVVGTFLYQNINQRELTVQQAPVFVISGSLGAAQTDAALHDFFESYMPVLERVCPDARVIVTGRNPSESLVALCRVHSCVELVPSPEDIMAVIRRARYYLSPINTGGGLKLRIMDGLRQGLPVLAHDVSVRGYEAMVRDRVMLGYNNPATFETALRDFIHRKVMPEEVFASFKGSFSYSAGVQKLRDALTGI